MSPTTLIFLYVLGGLSLFFLLYIAIKVGRNFYRVKDKKPIKEEIVEPEVVSTEETALNTEVIEPITETTEEVKAEEPVAEPVVEPEVVAPSNLSEVKEVEPIEEVATTEDQTTDNEIVIADIDEEDELADKLNIKRVHFAQKLLKLDEHALLYYDEIYNKFVSFRGVNSRLSFKHVTFRHKRKLIAKLTIKGKTLKLHLALDTEAFNKNVYFQTSLADVKAYEEVPFTVKVKSARGLKNALALIEILCEKEGVELKARHKKINAIKEIMQVMGLN